MPVCTSTPGLVIGRYGTEVHVENEQTACAVCRNSGERGRGTAPGAGVAAATSRSVLNGAAPGVGAGCVVVEDTHC